MLKKEIPGFKLTPLEREILHCLPSFAAAIARAIWSRATEGEPWRWCGNTPVGDAFDRLRQKVSGHLRSLEARGVITSEQPELDERGYWVIMFYPV